LVRMSIRELEESQKMIIKLKLRTLQGAMAGILTFKDAQVKFYELILTTSEEGGKEFKKVSCLSKVEHWSESNPEYLRVKLFIPEYEHDVFPERQFQFELINVGFISFSGQDIMTLQSMTKE